jgi:hypothetical protein
MRADARSATRIAFTVDKATGAVLNPRWEQKGVKID